jgi:hypothetical protein
MRRLAGVCQGCCAAALLGGPDLVENGCLCGSGNDTASSQVTRAELYYEVNADADALSPVPFDPPAAGFLFGRLYRDDLNSATCAAA